MNNHKTINKSKQKYTWKCTTITNNGTEKTELLDENIFDSEKDAFEALKEKICTNIIQHKLSGQFYINTDTIVRETSSYKRIYEVVPLQSSVKDNVTFTIDFNLQGNTQEEIEDVKAQLSAQLQEFVNKIFLEEYDENIAKAKVRVVRN